MKSVKKAFGIVVTVALCSSNFAFARNKHINIDTNRISVTGKLGDFIPKGFSGEIRSSDQSDNRRIEIKQEGEDNVILKFCESRECFSHVNLSLSHEFSLERKLTWGEAPIVYGPSIAAFFVVLAIGFRMSPTGPVALVTVAFGIWVAMVTSEALKADLLGYIQEFAQEDLDMLPKAEFAQGNNQIILNEQHFNFIYNALLN